ncbi:hypothetical protein C7I55_06590 [Sphingomonas deserti]|uniref:Uncharacterized protein n=1 Tax=Allosphingosinicella deserti TaxID=2116704 RepID=A0A2P7QWH0_9SPHN|nr:hypothetical protein C7I55_06590 [Sphingomonas deserti]
MEATFEGARERLTDTLIARALDGDMTAMRLCLARIAPPPRDVPIALDLDSVRDARETLEASSAVITAMAEGEVTPMEASRAMTVLVKHKTIVECELLERRMTALEEHLKTLDRT